MGLMALNLATLNVRGLRDSRQCAHLLAELKYLSVDVTAMQETSFAQRTVGYWKRILTFSQYTTAAVALGSPC